MTAHCGSCRTQIDWALTVPGGKPMPIDHDSAGAADGNMAVWRDPQTGRLLCRVLRAGEDPGRGQRRARNHWSTCVNAAEHKKATSSRG